MSAPAKRWEKRGYIRLDGGSVLVGETSTGLLTLAASLAPDAGSAEVAAAEQKAGMAIAKSRESLLEALKQCDRADSPPSRRAAHHARLAATALDDALTTLASEAV